MLTVTTCACLRFAGDLAFLDPYQILIHAPHLLLDPTEFLERLRDSPGSVQTRLAPPSGHLPLSEASFPLISSAPRAQSAFSQSSSPRSSSPSPTSPPLSPFADSSASTAPSAPVANATSVMGVLPFVLLALLALAPSPLLASKPKSPAHNARSLRHPPRHPRHSRRSASTACPSAGTVGVYWPAWSTGVQPPGSLSWDKVDLAFYVLVETTSSGIGIPQGQTKDDIKLFVKEAHAGQRLPFDF